MVKEWQCNECGKGGCKRYTDVPVFQDRKCPDAIDPDTIAHYTPVIRQEITEDQYLEALKIYLEFAYPDGKPIWRTFFGKRTPTNDIGCNLRRASIYRNASEEPSRSFFFRHGIPSSITFGSWIQPHMKLRYDDIQGDGVKKLWVESNERSEDGEWACDLSVEIKHQIENAWKENLQNIIKSNGDGK